MHGFLELNMTGIAVTLGVEMAELLYFLHLTILNICFFGCNLNSPAEVISEVAAC